MHQTVTFFFTLEGKAIKKENHFVAGSYLLIPEMQILLKRCIERCFVAGEHNSVKCPDAEQSYQVSAGRAAENIE